MPSTTGATISARRRSRRASVSAKQFEKTQFMYDIIAEVPAANPTAPAIRPWAKAATAAMAAQHRCAWGYTETF